MEKLKASLLPAYRARRLAEQGGVCELCGDKPAVPCLDHCHKEGHVRGVLCRGCNAMLGKLENNRLRNGLGNPGKWARFLSNIVPYLHRHAMGTVLHPTFKTDDEKRLARNAKARKTRAAARKEG